MKTFSEIINQTFSKTSEEWSKTHFLDNLASLKYKILKKNKKKLNIFHKQTFL